MVYTRLTKLAIKIAYEQHKGQVDKSGVPYIHHPLHLAEQMTNEASCCAALLHDVAEDTDMTFEELEKLGFYKEIIDALKLLTHDESVPYLDYVRMTKENPIARAVKLADLTHNSDRTRVENPDEGMLAQWEKYDKAIKILQE